MEILTNMVVILIAIPVVAFLFVLVCYLIMRFIEFMVELTAMTPKDTPKGQTGVVHDKLSVPPNLTKPLKVLNLYAGIGGNRKLWDNVEVTAVESEQYIADVYTELYPSDTVIVGDAHKYLLEHFQEFDFIWGSPPCPSHSRLSTASAGWGIYRYPDMKLYEEILLLQHFYKGDWVIENVIPYYKPLIQPMAELDRHLFWSNRHIPKTKGGRSYEGEISSATVQALADSHGIVLPPKTKNQRKLLRNAVDPALGLHVFNAVGLQKSETVTGENLTLALASPNERKRMEL